MIYWIGRYTVDIFERRLAYRNWSGEMVIRNPRMDWSMLAYECEHGHHSQGSARNCVRRARMKVRREAERLGWPTWRDPRDG